MKYNIHPFLTQLKSKFMIEKYATIDIETYTNKDRILVAYAVAFCYKYVTSRNVVLPDIHNRVFYISDYSDGTHFWKDIYEYAFKNLNGYKIYAHN